MLKAFEARVRQGTAARNPTLFEYEGSVYRVVSTGIFAAQPHRRRPAIRTSTSGATSIRTTRARTSISSSSRPSDVPDDDSGSEVLGIWTSHIALLFGRPLKARRHADDLSALRGRLRNR